MSAAPAAQTPLPVARVPIAIRWRDLDAFNHVNNSNFLTYIEEARLVWLSALDGSWFNEDVAPLVAAIHMNYRRPLSWPGQVIVELFCAKLGTTSLTIGHRIVAPDDAECVYADGEAVMVWIQPQTGRPVPLPDVIRRAAQSPVSGATTSK